MAAKIVEILSKIGPFGNLPSDVIEGIANTFYSRKYHAGQRLMRRGEIITEIGLVDFGEILLMMHTPVGEAVRCGILRKGDFMVNAGLMTNGRSVVCAYCKTPVLCYMQGRLDYLAMIETHPQIKDFFYELTLAHITMAFESMRGGSIQAPTQVEDDIDSASFPRVIRKALVHIEKNFMNPLNLAEVAQINGMSKYHFSRIFKEQTGCTFIDYLNQRRIKKAKYLIEHEEINITQAAFAVGYNDLSYFSRRFKEYEGILPSQYKKIPRNRGK